MKKAKFRNIILLTATLLTAVFNYGFTQDENDDFQAGKGYHKMHDMLNLTEDQENKIKDLKISYMKDRLALKNQLDELKAKQKSLTTADNADMKAIYANIDEMTTVKNKLMKAKAKHIQEVRSILTEEQRVIFDSHQSMKKHGKNHKKMEMQGGMHQKGIHKGF